MRREDSPDTDVDDKDSKVVSTFLTPIGDTLFSEGSALAINGDGGLAACSGSPTVKRRAALSGADAEAAAAARFFSKRSLCFWRAGERYFWSTVDTVAAGITGDLTPTGDENEITGEVAPESREASAGASEEAGLSACSLVLLYLEMGGKGLPLAARRARC